MLVNFCRAISTQQTIAVRSNLAELAVGLMVPKWKTGVIKTLTEIRENLGKDKETIEVQVKTVETQIIKTVADIETKAEKKTQDLEKSLSEFRQEIENKLNSLRITFD